MKTESEKTKSEGESLGILAGMLLFVINGLRNKSITSKPILLMDDDSENYETTSLESEIWKTLNKVGIQEKK